MNFVAVAPGRSERLIRSAPIRSDAQLQVMHLLYAYGVFWLFFSPIFARYGHLKFTISRGERKRSMFDGDASHVLASLLT